MHTPRFHAEERARTPQVEAALRRLMPPLGTPPSPAADLARLALPAILTWGRDDLQVPPRIAEAAGARFGRPLRAIDDARDEPANEQPHAFPEAPRDGSPAAGRKLTTTLARRTP